MADLSAELPLTREGDDIRLSYPKTEKTVIDVTAFDNLKYLQK